MRSSAVIGLSLWLGDIRVYRVRLIDAVSRIYDIDPQSPVPLSRSPLLDHRAGLFPGVWTHPKSWTASAKNLRPCGRLSRLPRLMDQGQRRPMTNCAMRSHSVVFDPPFFNLFAGVV